MDFTQHNKINSRLPIQNRGMDCRPSPKSYSISAKNFNIPQYQKVTHGPNYPSYSTAMQQQQNFQRTQRMQQHGDGTDKVTSISKIYKPYTFNTPAMGPCMAPQKNSFYDDSMMIRQQEIDPMMVEDQMVSMPDTNDDLNIEFLPCAPPPHAQQGKSTNPRANPFQPVLESMRKYSETDTAKQVIENHQTYFFSHNGQEDANENRDVREENDEQLMEEILNQQNSYRSRTKIVPIHNGVRIVTDIVKNGGECCGNEMFRNFRHLSSQDKWCNKSKIILDDDSNKQSSAGDSNSNEKPADDDDCGEEERESLINL